MFQLHREMDRLDLPAGEVFQLQRSLNRIQVGLPGFPSQEAEAYLCLFASGQGMRAAIVLHLQASRCLAVYLNEPGAVSTSRATGLLDEGIGFAQSMGFMLGDLDFPLLSDKEKGALWESLPLRKGLEPAPGSAGKNAPPAVASPPASQPAAAAPAPASSPAPKKSAPAAGKTPARPVAPAPAGPSDQTVPMSSVPLESAAPAPSRPETLPEVPLPRTLRAPKGPLTPEEIAGKRRQLREAVGKLLSSL